MCVYMKIVEKNNNRNIIKATFHKIILTLHPKVFEQENRNKR